MRNLIPQSINLLICESVYLGSAVTTCSSFVRIRAANCRHKEGLQTTESLPLATLLCGVNRECHPEQVTGSFYVTQCRTFTLDP